MGICQGKKYGDADPDRMDGSKKSLAAVATASDEIQMVVQN
jgi:hypothetical protein